ncbi:hypothetical protein Pcinc_023595 [Petrolisthes cinctipes]|uniref:Uncharacterized protein n=1 Tax=Petrolisthes cinctipes TaxID=88211 RepID=A0AAE1KGK7_PETCI|nr:hypothetical protein Pcinc_023595 [Petrolisthes cinctipes]
MVAFNVTNNPSKSILARNIINLGLAIFTINFLVQSEYKIKPCLSAIRLYSAGIILVQLGCKLFLPTNNTRKDNNVIIYSNSSNNKAKAQKKSSKILDVLSVLLWSVGSVVLVHVITVLYGAYLIQNFDETLTLSILVSSLAFIRPIITYGPHTLTNLLHRLQWEEECEGRCVCVLFGTLLAAAPIPLDWDTPWQVWPMSCSIGALLSEAGASVFFIVRELRVTTTTTSSTKYNVSKDCQELKRLYDSCFNQWYSEKFLRGQTNDTSCDPIYKQYKQCVGAALAKLRIEIPSTMLQRVKKSLSQYYRNYELVTAIYMLEPREKAAMNLFFLTITGLITYSSYVHLPHYTSTMLAFFGFMDVED